MPKASPFDSISRRLSVYGYLAPILDGARVLEIGIGDGAGAAHLLKLGAASVVGADADAQAVSRARASHRQPGLSFAPLERRALEGAGGFDVIVVPEAATLLRAGSGLTPAAAQALLSGRQGRLVLTVPSSDWPAAPSGTGFGFYEVTEALEGLFPRVRMFGVTPFAAYGVAEFSEATSGLRIDGGLVDETAEQPTHYVALAGPDDGIELGMPWCRSRSSWWTTGPGAIASRPAAVAAGADLADVAGVADLRRRLAEAEGKAEGVLRVSRAQSEEIRGAARSVAPGGRVAGRARSGGRTSAPGAGRGRRVGAGSHPPHPGGDDGAGVANHRRAASVGHRCRRGRRRRADRPAARGDPPARGGAGRPRVGAVRAGRPHRRSGG